MTPLFSTGESSFLEYLAPANVFADQFWLTSVFLCCGVPHRMGGWRTVAVRGCLPVHVGVDVNGERLSRVFLNPLAVYHT